MEFEYKSIAQAGKEAYDYIKARKDGTIKSLKTGWDKLDSTLLDGIEWHNVVTVAGLSGSGKTLLLNQLETGLHDLNPKEDFVSLNFNLEMACRTLIIRKLASSRALTMKQLLSAETGFTMTDKDLSIIESELRNMAKYNVYYVDKPHTVAGLAYIVNQFWNKFKKPMVVSLDHSILVRRSSSDLNTTDMLYNLAESLNEMKKVYPVIFVIASQLNREIENVDRMKRPSALQFPTKTDIFGSDALYMMSDTLIVNHRPSQLNITHYGPERWEVAENDIFWHVLKNRNGSTPILKMLADFKHMRIIEDEYFETKLTG